MLAHSSEEDVQRRVAEVLFGVASANGRLSASIPGLYEEGAGVDITPTSIRHYTPEELGMDGEVLSGIDRIAQEGIEAKAYPGCRVYALRNGKVLYDKSFGAFTYGEAAHKVEGDDLYDLASLSKMTGTLLAVMKLYDEGRLNLSDRASQYLPFLKGTDKEEITIRDLRKWPVGGCRSIRCDIYDCLTVFPEAADHVIALIIDGDSCDLYKRLPSLRFLNTLCEEKRTGEEENCSCCKYLLH